MESVSTLFLFEVPAVLTADVLLGVPHTFSILGADGFGGVTVTALTLAGAVALALDAELGFTPGDEVASGIALGVSTEIQPGHVGDVKVDPDGLGAAGSVFEGESGSRADAVGGDFVDVDAVDASRALAGGAGISDTDGSAEGFVFALELNLEGGVLGVGVGGELDGGGPFGTVHVVVVLGRRWCRSQ